MYKIIWRTGTAYDLFISLRILHIPEMFGLRAKWASGMRARLSPDARTVLSQAETLLFAKRPVHWVEQLDAPRDTAVALKALVDIPPAERLPTLAITAETDPALAELLREVAKSGRWTNDHLTEVRRRFYWWNAAQPSLQEAAEMLNLWSDAGRFGERYLAMLQEYAEVFFFAEERRIRPVLERALDHAQTRLANDDPLTGLNGLTGGLAEQMVSSEIRMITLQPSYWVTPYAFFLKAAADHLLVSFRGRPAGASLIPGEAVADTLIAGLKALADPTRLRILQILISAPATPGQISRTLRLRSATIAHHIKQLQIVGLVSIYQRSGQQVLYTAAGADLDELLHATRTFANQSVPNNEE